jgi:RimJ/RimL family protein N-acetyltransferase
MNTNWLYKITLPGKYVTLIPFDGDHLTGLSEAASDGKLWELWYTSVPNNLDVEKYFAQALQEQQAGTALVFTVIDNASKKIIGTTRYCNADASHYRLEIGYTWYAKSFQRTGANTECKYLLLKHAFEALNCIAVEFRTHWHNQASRAAIARLGAKQDGILRNHRKDAEGIYRDTVVFSIIDHEWPTVRKSLEFMMSARK